MTRAAVTGNPLDGVRTCLWRNLPVHRL